MKEINLLLLFFFAKLQLVWKSSEISFLHSPHIMTCISLFLIFLSEIYILVIQAHATVMSLFGPFCFVLHPMCGLHRALTFMIKKIPEISGRVIHNTHGVRSREQRDSVLICFPFLFWHLTWMINKSPYLQGTQVISTRKCIIVLDQYTQKSFLLVLLFYLHLKVNILPHMFFLPSGTLKKKKLYYL